MEKKLSNPKGLLADAIALLYCMNFRCGDAILHGQSQFKQFIVSPKYARKTITF
jgi:hypothetical protein